MSQCPAGDGLKYTATEPWASDDVRFPKRIFAMMDKAYTRGEQLLSDGFRVG